MKIAKKLLAVVMALAMIAALSAVAFAASATFGVTDNGDGTYAVSVKFADAVGLKSGKLYFGYENGKVTKIAKKNGADAKNIGDVDNAFSSEFNSTINPAEFGFYFKENLWDSATWAAAENADAAVNGENFEAAVFTFTGEAGTKVTVTGNLVIGETSVPVDTSFVLGEVKETWDAGKVTKEATCTEKGVKTFTSNLGNTKTEEIPALGHKWDEGKVTTAATCTAEGVKTFTCSVCGATKTESIAKIAHSYGSDGKCTVCGAAKPVAPSKTEKEYDIEPNNNGIPYVCPCGNKDCKCTNKDCKCDGKTAASKCTDAKCACNAKAADKPTEKAAANNGTKTTPKTDGGKNTGDNSVLAIMAGVIALAGAAYVATKKRK
jgi:LPXTG-motif cell wall-anchored protein